MIKVADSGLDCMHIGRRRKKQNMTGMAHNTSHCRSPGWDSLAVAVIEQAITDYFILVHANVIRYGNLTGYMKGKRNNRKNGRVYYSYVVSGIPKSDAQSTIDFIRDDVAKWASYCELESEQWRGLYKAIINRERSGKHYFHYNSERGRADHATT